MDISSIIALLVLLGFYILAIKISLDSDYRDIPALIDVLKKELKIFTPISLVMVGYQIYTTGYLRVCPQTSNYILLFLDMGGLLPVLMYKFLKHRKEFFQGKFIAGLSLNIVFLPVFSIALIVIEVFGIK